MIIGGVLLRIENGFLDFEAVFFSFVVRTRNSSQASLDIAPHALLMQKSS